MTRVLVCGGRDYADMNRVYEVLGRLHARTPFSLLINGAARGADTLAQMWATRQRIPTEQYPANWDVYGNRAGPIRNQRMLSESRPDIVVAFKGGDGTQDMIDRAHKAKLPVLMILEPAVV